MSAANSPEVALPERVIVCGDGHKPAIADWAKDQMRPCDAQYIRADVVLDIIDKAGDEWGTQARDRRSKTYSAYALAALDLRGRIVEVIERESVG